MVAGGFTVGQDRAGHGRFLASRAHRTGRRGRVHARRRRAATAPAAVLGPGVRPGGPPPRPAPRHARSRLRPRQDARALRRRRRGAPDGDRRPGAARRGRARRR